MAEYTPRQVWYMQLADYSMSLEEKTELQMLAMMQAQNTALLQSGSKEAVNVVNSNIKKIEEGRSFDLEDIYIPNYGV